MPAAPAKPPPKASGTLDDALFRPAAQKVGANLEMLLGAPVVLKFEPARRFTPEEAREGVPGDGVVVVGGAAVDAEQELAFVVDRRLALTLACMLQMLPETAVKSRLGELASTDLAAGEKESVGEIGNFMIAAVGEKVRDLAGAQCKLTQAPTRYLTGEGAVALDAALPGGGYLGCLGTMKAGAFDEYPIRMYFADGLGRTVAPQAYVEAAPAAAAPAAGGPAVAGAAPTAGQPAVVGAPAAAPAAAPGVPAPGAGGSAALAAAAAPSATPGTPAAGGVAVAAPTAAGPVAVFDAAGASVALCGSDAFRARGQAAVPAGAVVAAVPGVGALYDAAEAGGPPALAVLEVPAGKEHLLEVAGSVRRLPGAATTSWLIVLGRPTRRNVLRCVAAGLFDVVPADVSDEILSRRMAAALAARR